MSASSPDALVLRAVNASLPVEVDAASLVRSIRDPQRHRLWFAHLEALFSEVPVAALEAFAHRHGVAMDALAQAYRSVREAGAPVSEELDDWFGYLQNPPA